MKRIAVVSMGMGLAILLCGLTTWRVVDAMTRRSDVADAAGKTIATAVEVVQAAPRDLVDEVRVAGTLRALHEADVVAEVPGRVEAVLVDVGARVTKGQALARLDAEDLGLQVQQAEAALAAARAGLSSADQDHGGGVSLAAAGGLSVAQLKALEGRLAATEAQVAQAEAALGMARTRYADATLRAPFAGIVVRRRIDIGGQVAPGQPAFGIADLSALELVIDVDERVAARLKPADAVAVSSDMVADLPAGVVKTVAPMLDPLTHKAQIVVSIAYTPGLFGHGGASATFQVGEAAGVIAVPRGAVIEDNGENVVFVVDGGIARRTVVVTGLREGDWLEVSGIPVGASVVVAGSAYLSDGAAVAVRTPEPT